MSEAMFWRMEAEADTRKRQQQALRAEWDYGYEAGKHDYLNNIVFNQELCDELGENWASGYAAGHSVSDYF
jgi:hypothetical protein